MSECYECKLVAMGKGRSAMCYDCLEERNVELQAELAELEQQLADANERIQVLEMEVKGRNPDGTLIPATPFHQKEEGNDSL